MPQALLFYALEAIRGAGITDIGTVVRETAPEIRPAVGAWDSITSAGSRDQGVANSPTSQARCARPSLLCDAEACRHRGLHLCSDHDVISKA